MNVRRASWCDDRDGIGRIDTAHSSDRVVRIDADDPDFGFSFYDPRQNPSDAALFFTLDL